MLDNYKDLTDARVSGELEGVRPYVEEFVRRKIAIIEQRVFMLSDQSIFTAEMAMASWMEVKALRRLMSSIEQAKKVAQIAAQRIAPVVSLTPSVMPPV